MIFDPQMEVEYRAWGTVCVELQACGINLDKQDALAAALKRWGEELVELRLGQDRETSLTALNEARGNSPALAINDHGWQRDPDVA